MTMIVDVARTTPRGTEAVGVPVFTEGPVPRSLGVARATLASLGFEGKVGQTHALPGTNGQLLIAVGMGDPAKVTTSTLRTAAAALARAARKRATVATGLVDVLNVDAKSAAQAVVEGVVLASYSFGGFKSESTPSAIERLTLLADGPKAKNVAIGAERGVVVAEAVTFARDLINTPPAHLTARDFAAQAEAIAADRGLAIEVVDEVKAAELGLGGLLGVNAGSVEPPRLVKLTYSPRNPTGTLTLVGKGVMYDSGGISLKPSDASHATMKMDMSGAAAVLAALSALKALKVKTKVIGYMVCTDNMPSGSAMKLGDVLKMRNGKTVEVHNTDAEGRLILADGLSLAVEDGTDAIVDIATLTGACMAALGLKYAGLMGNSQPFIDQVRDAAGRADENVWPLPLPGEYRKLIDSNIADMKNIGGPYGGALIAGLFLKEFVGDTPWAHLDMAGPMNSDADEGWLTKGGTAWGVRTFLELAERFTPPAR